MILSFLTLTDGFSHTLSYLSEACGLSSTALWEGWVDITHDTILKAGVFPGPSYSSQ